MIFLGIGKKSQYIAETTKGKQEMQQHLFIWYSVTVIHVDSTDSTDKQILCKRYHLPHYFDTLGKLI